MQLSMQLLQKSLSLSLFPTLFLLAAGNEVFGSPGNEPVTVGWEEIEQAIDRHPALRVAGSNVDEAAGAVGASRQYPNPVLGVGLGRAEAVEGEEEDRIWELEVSFPILSFGAYRADISAAKAERDAVTSEAAALRLEVIRQLSETFYRIAHDQQRLATLEESGAQLDALIEVARLRVEMGEARPLEPSRLEIERSRVGVEITEARETARMRRSQLNLWLGSALPSAFRVQADLSELPELPRLEEVVAQAVARHPEIHAAANRLRAQSARLKAEQWRRFPEIEVAGFYEKELDARSVGGAVEIAVPLWNWNSGKIAQARAAKVRTQHDQQLKLIEIETAARESHAAAVVALEKSKSFRDVILPKASETTSALERMYQIGEVDVMDVLDARRGLIEIEAELLEANLESQLAYLEMVTLMGGDNHE
jgi:cobalt-zinc-cadmium efflux system outer membrane protein